MQCPCGGETKLSTRELKTSAGVSNWLQRETDIKRATLKENKCSDCGRLQMELIGPDGNLLTARG